MKYYSINMSLFPVKRKWQTKKVLSLTLKEVRVGAELQFSGS